MNLLMTMKLNITTKLSVAFIVMLLISMNNTFTVGFAETPLLKSSTHIQETSEHKGETIPILDVSGNESVMVDSSSKKMALNSVEGLSAKNGSFESTGSEIYGVLLSADDWVFDGAASTVGVMASPAELGFPAATDGNKALYIGVDNVNGAVTSGKAFQDFGQSSAGMIYTVTAQVNRGHLYAIGYKLSLRDAVTNIELASTKKLGNVSFYYIEDTPRTLRLQVETSGTIGPTAALRTSIDNIVIRQQNAKNFDSAVVGKEENSPLNSQAKQKTATSNSGLRTSADNVVSNEQNSPFNSRAKQGTATSNTDLRTSIENMIGRQQNPSLAKGFVFAVVGKEENSPFYLQVKQGCIAAANKLTNVKCIYLGPERRDVRLQNFIIEELVNNKVDAIAVSVTQSKWLSSNGLLKAKEAGIPVITFNSDIELTNENLRLAYIGSDNFEIGKAMGMALKKLKPQGGKVIILSGRKDATNLNQRILGVRQTLVGENDTASLTSLLGDLKGWYELRAPYYSYGRPEMANEQFSKMLSPAYNADVLISVGDWPQSNSDYYREMVKPFEIKIKNKWVPGQN